MSVARNVENVHERGLRIPRERVGSLIDGLASRHDALWPRDRWPAMRFDRPLAVGARGGHGPIRYVVERYEPGRSIWFRFTAPRGFVGGHGFEVLESPRGSVLRHSLRMRIAAPALVTWPLVFRPLHDALIEDSLDRAELAVTGAVASPAKWSPLVRLLRRALRRSASPPGR